MILFSPKPPFRLCGAPSLLEASGGSFAGMKGPGRETDHTDAKNEWRYSSPLKYDFVACTRTTLPSKYSGVKACSFL
jgi:hypothetical protein